MNGIAITGYGSLSALGNNNETFLNAFLKNKSGIRINDEYSQIFNVNPFLLAPSQEPDPEKFNIKMPSWRLDSDSKKAIYVTSEALLNANFDPTFFEQYDNIGIILATTYTCVEKMWQNMQSVVEKGVRSIKPFKCITGANSVLASVCARFRLRGYNNIFTNPMVSSYSAIKCAYDRIKTNKNKAMIVLTGDSLSDVLIRLVWKTGLLQSENSVMRSAPFDNERSGMILGEAFGALVLEDVDHAKRRGAHIHAIITGIDICNTSNSKIENSLEIAMRNVVEHSKDRNIDFIYATANSNGFYDQYESQALLECIDNCIEGSTYITALKSLIGETFSSAGVMQVIAAIESMRNNYLPSIHELHNIDSEFKKLNFLQESINGISLQAGLINGMDLRGNCCYSIRIEKSNN